MSQKALQQYWLKASPSIGYNFFEKRWTGPPAYALLQQAGLISPPKDEPLRILDHACGMGIVAALLYEVGGIVDRDDASSMEIVCGDISPNMVDAAKQRLEKGGWKGYSVQTLDAQDSKLPDNTFTHVLCSLGYALMPQPELALKDSVRILQPSGTLGFTAWTAVGWVEDMNINLARLGAPLLNMESTVTKGWTDPTHIRSQLESTPGIDQSTIKLEPFIVDCQLSSVQDYTDNAGAMVGMIMAGWTDEQKNEFEGRIMPELRKVLEEKHGVGKPFSIRMDAVIVIAKKRPDNNF